MRHEDVRKQLAEASAPPAEERSDLIDEFARNLPDSYEHGQVDLDYDELDRRMEAVRRGTAVVVSWEEARGQILPSK